MIAPIETFREWAERMGYRVKRQPDALAGDDHGLGVPLMARRGWLWDAGPNVGIDFRAPYRALAPVAAALQALPTFRLQTYAPDDAILGWVTREEWSEEVAAIVRPLRRPQVSQSEAARASRLAIRARNPRAQVARLGRNTPDDARKVGDGETSAAALPD